MLMEGQLQEETIEIEKDSRIEFWLELVKSNSTPPTARINLNSVTSRSLAKAIWSSSSIVALDVSRMKLPDLAGAYLCRALKNNRSIVKLDLESNHFGPKTCATLADSLAINDVVRHVNLESNNLVRGDGDSTNDWSGVEALADMLASNKTIVYLNLWRCNVQSQGGHIMFNGIQNNDTLIFFELGNNGLGQHEQKKLAEKLERNKEKYEAEQAQRQEKAKKKQEEDAIIKAKQDAMTKEENLKLWMEDQKVLRANARREEMEEKERVRRVEEKQRILEEEERRKKEAEAQAAKDAKKKKKKKKK